MRRWCAVALWMGLIFVLSAMPSLHVPGWFLSDFIMRKLSHIGAYAVLTALLWWALRMHMDSRLRAGILAVLVAGLYALSDEWHQTWVSGRHGSFRDVGIDALGVIGSYVLVQVAYIAACMTQTTRQCPECAGTRLHRSRRRGLTERCLSVISLYPFRCDICDFRFRRFRRQIR